MLDTDILVVCNTSQPDPLIEKISHKPDLHSSFDGINRKILSYHLPLSCLANNQDRCDFKIAPLLQEKPNQCCPIKNFKRSLGS